MAYTIVAHRFMLCRKTFKRIHRKLSRYFVVLSHGEISGCRATEGAISRNLVGVSVNNVDVFIF